MKTTLALLALSLSFASTSFAADLNLHIHSTTTLKKTDKDVFEKISEVATSETTLIVNGQAQTANKKMVNSDKLTYTIEKNLIKIQDEKAGVDTEMAASVERSLFGRTKSFSISGENLENAYYQSLESQGVIALRDLDLKKDQRKSLVIGDQNCTVDKSTELATCEQDVDLKVNNNGFVLAAALIALQLGN